MSAFVISEIMRVEQDTKRLLLVVLTNQGLLLSALEILSPLNKEFGDIVNNQVIATANLCEALKKEVL